MYELLTASFQVVKRLSVLTCGTASGAVNNEAHLFCCSRKICNFFIQFIYSFNFILVGLFGNVHFVA